MPATIAQTKLPDTGTLLFSLSEIDNEWIENYRTDAEEEALDDLRDSIVQDTDHKSGTLGVKQPILGCWNKEKTKALLSAGFRRLEASYQIALKKVIDEYNEHFKYDKTNEKFVHVNGNPLGSKGKPSTIERQRHRDQVRQQGGEWQQKFDDALAHYKIEVSLQDYGDIDTDDSKAMAKMDNLVENTIRTDPSFFDELKRVVMLKEAGYAGRSISRKLKMPESTISQFMKIYRLGDTLRKRFSGDELDKAYPNPEDKAKALATLETGIAEFLHRMKASPKDDTVIEISKAKQITYALDNDKEPLRLPDALHFLSFVTRLNDEGRPTKLSTPDMATIDSQIRAKRQLAKAPAVAEAPAAAAPQPTADANASALNDAVAQAVANIEAGATAPVQGTAPAATTAPVVVPPKPVTDPKLEAASETLTGDKAIEAQIAAQNRAAAADVPPAEAMEVPAMDTEMSFEEIANLGASLEESEANDEMAAAAAASKATPGQQPVPTGEMRTSTTTAEIVKYRQTPPEAIEKRAADHVNQTATFEGASIFEVASALAAANELFSIIGLKKQERAVNEASIKYTDAANGWLAALESHFEATASDELKAQVAQLKPTYTPPSLS